MKGKDESKKRRGMRGQGGQKGGLMNIKTPNIVSFLKLQLSHIHPHTCNHMHIYDTHT